MSILESIPKGAKVSITQNYTEYRGGGSSKFYRTLVVTNELDGEKRSTAIMNWGAIGTAGQKQYVRNVNGNTAHSRANKKIIEKERKGYEKAKAPSPRNAGTMGQLNSHVFGGDKLKDKEAISILAATVGSEADLKGIFDEIGIFSLVVDKEEAERLRLAQEQKAREIEQAERERLQAIEDARSSTYSTSWGDWA